jgi:hypothetical protein
MKATSSAAERWMETAASATASPTAKASGIRRGSDCHQAERTDRNARRQGCYFFLSHGAHQSKLQSFEPTRRIVRRVVLRT